MISDGQRREIAANLRSESEAWRDTFPDAMTEEEAIGAAIMSDLVVFAGLDDSSPVHEIYARLADLIDRPTCRNVHDGREFECSACGMQWHLLDRADSMEEWAHVRSPRHCPGCGAEVIPDAERRD